MKPWRRSDIKAVLLDLDGVLYIGDQLIPGAALAVQQLKSIHNIRVTGVTNTTTSSRRVIARKLADFDIPIDINDIYTPAALAAEMIGASSAALYVRDSLLEDFHGIHTEGERPAYIVMGDLGDNGYTPLILHTIFNQVMAGTELLALHKNRFWQKPDGLHLDLGPFVAAIEYATNTQATVLGKPSQAFFHRICTALHVSPEQAVMVGDDIESDIYGAQQAGLHTALVQTGKYRHEFALQTGIQADTVLTSICDLPKTLN